MGDNAEESADRSRTPEPASPQEVIDHVPAGICVYQQGERGICCVCANGAFARLLGTDVSALRGEPLEGLFARVHLQDQERCRTELTALFTGRAEVSGTYRVCCGRDGVCNWLHFDGWLDTAAVGGPRACFSCTNVNPLMQNELSFGDSQQVLRSIVKHVPGGVFVYSAAEDARFAFVSENMLMMLGYTREEFDRRFNGRFVDMIYADDRARVLAEIDSQIAVGPYDTCTYRIEKKDGTLLWVHDEGHIVTDALGKRWFYVVIVDITSSVRSRENLVSQNQELRQLIDNIPVSIIVYKKTNGQVSIEAVNGYLNRQVSVPAEQLRGMSGQKILAHVHEEDREAVVRFFHDLFEGDGRMAEITYRTTFEEGQSYQWFHCSAIRPAAKEGADLVYAVYTDATYQKVKEEDFNRIIQELLSTNPNSLCAFRLNLTRNLCSDGHGSSSYIRQLLAAATADELLERIAAIITNEGEAQKFRERFCREKLIESFNSGEERVSTTYHRLTDNGESHWVTTYFHILRNPYTGDIEAIAYSVDSDYDRKDEEIVSIVTGEEYDYIGLIDTASGKVSYFYYSDKNATAAGRLPAMFADAVQIMETRMASPADIQQYRRGVSLKTVRAALEKDPVYIFSYNCLCGPQREKRRKQTSFRYLEPDHKEIMFSRADITAVFRNEERYTLQLQQALLAAEKANEMKSDFLGNVSHDMRTPLNAILGYNELALAAGSAEEKDSYLHKIEVAGHTLLTLINDTLDLQKIENGANELRLGPVRCSAVIRDIVASVKPLMEKKNIEFVLDNSRAVMATINTDAVRLRQIFINLLSNAVKFTPEGGRIDLVIECVGLEKDRVLDRIIVRDNGIGMSAEFQQKMFEPFSQERTSATAHIGGSGLGLSIVRRIVDLMGGRIEVRSALGQGTEFTVYLDFERLDDRLPLPEEQLNLPQDIRGKQVLLCEDNEMNTEIARRILEMYGASVVCEPDGRSGAERFIASAAGDFDIVLMDIRMPVMDGYAATRRIRDSAHPLAKSIPILAMSADAYASDVEKAILSGMNGHIAKPIDPKKLVSEIARLTAGPARASAE